MKHLFMMLLMGGVVFGAAGQGELKLPDLGNPSDRVLSPDQELMYRKNIRQQMYQYNFMMSDPAVADYIHHLGFRLVPFSENPKQGFEFHVVPVDVINASAYPGGLVVIFSGLFLETESESELAGVVAHEIAHVNQRHISRMLAKQRKSVAPILLGMVAAIAAAQSSSSGDAPIAIAASMQALQAQMQINFTRFHEYEADRVGIKTLHASGLNPEGMATFFAKLMQKNRVDPRYQLPEYLRTHPLSVNRVTEAKNRINHLTVESINESALYPFIKERIRVFTASNNDDLSQYYEKARSQKHDLAALRYGLALQYAKNNQYAKAKQVADAIQAPKEVMPLIAALQTELAVKLAPEDTVELVKQVTERYPYHDVVKALMVRVLMKADDLKAQGLAISYLRQLLIEHGDNPHYHDWLSIAYYNAIKPIDSGMAMARKNHLLGWNYKAVRILKNLKKESLDYYQLAEVDAMIARYEPLITEDEFRVESDSDRRTRIQ